MAARKLWKIRRRPRMPTEAELDAMQALVDANPLMGPLCVRCELKEAENGWAAEPCDRHKPPPPSYGLMQVLPTTSTDRPSATSLVWPRVVSGRWGVGSARPVREPGETPDA